MIKYKKGACLSKKWRMELYEILDIQRAINNALAWRPVKLTFSVNCEIVKTDSEIIEKSSLKYRHEF